MGAVTGVRLTPDTNFEFRLLEVTLVSSRHLPRRRRRFGIAPALSELRKRNRGALDRFFETNPVLAVVRRTGNFNDVSPKIVRLVQDELAFLAASQLGTRARTLNATPRLASIPPHEVASQLFLNVTQYSLFHPNMVVGRFGELVLDSLWKEVANGLFFAKALKLLRRGRVAASAWKRDLKNALILIGQSQTSVDLPQAFLWDMIALELLLTRWGDKVESELPRRAEAFLGWSTDWKVRDFPDRIREVYRKRNRLVHQGQRDLIKPEDVLFVDELLLNILANIVAHPKLFASKDRLIEFSRNVEAERVLGVKPQVRPKTLRYSRRRLSPRDFEW